MSFASISVPPAYGFVLLGVGILPFFTSGYMGSVVMDARKRLNVQYPNLYAVPGFHKEAEEFNRIQRAHQNYLEGLDMYIVSALIGGLQHPIVCAIGTVCHSIGSILYMRGYMDMKLEVATARYKRGGAIKWIGVLSSLFCTGKMAYNVIMAKA